MLVDKNGQLIIERPEVPSPIIVNVELINRVGVFFFKGEEVITLVVGQGERGFEVEEALDLDPPQWMITVQFEGHGSERFDTAYTFLEPIEVICIAEGTPFEELATRIEQPAERLLILERLNKSII